MKNNKGMTLVELVVSLAVAAILFASVSVILFTSFKAFNNINDSNQDKMIGDSVYILISDKIMTASKVSILSQQSLMINDTDTISISANGTVVYNGVELYENTFYQNRTMTISITQYSSDKVSIYVSVYYDNKLSYSTGSVVKMLNYEFS